MSVLASFFQALIYPSYLIIHYYIYIAVVAVVLSWLDAFNVLNNSNALVNAVRDTVRRLTEPYFALFRRFVPPVGMLDFSALIGFFVLLFLERFVPNLLYRLSGAAG